MALTDGLDIFWKFNATGGTRPSSVGDHTLVDNNTVGSGAGKFGNGALMVRTASEYLSLTDRAEIRLGAAATRTFAFWLKMTDLGATQTIFAKDGPSLATQRDYGLEVMTSGLASWFIFRGDSSLFSRLDSAAGAIVAGQWHLVRTWWDGPNNTTGMQIDDNAAITASHTASEPAATSAPFWIGGRAVTGSPQHASMTIDEFGIWNRILTSDEHAALWNGGDGVDLLVSGSSGGRASKRGHYNLLGLLG